MIVLDTHAWIWWRADPGRLSVSAARAIADADRIGVSSISVWELGMLIRRGRISLDRDVAHWVRQALADAGSRFSRRALTWRLPPRCSTTISPAIRPTA